MKDKKYDGTRYDINGKIIYILSNRNNGFGIEYDDKENFLLYEGRYLNGKRNEYGKEYYNNGKLKFIGAYRNIKKWEGKGYDRRNKVVYKLKNGAGLVKEYNKMNFITFEGEYANGEKNGKGKEYRYNGKSNILKYEGEYLNGKRNGRGKKYNKDGELKFEGLYLYGFKLKGKLYVNNRIEYDGNFLYDKKWNGKEYDELGNVIYEIINGKFKAKEDNYNEGFKY